MNRMALAWVVICCGSVANAQKALLKPGAVYLAKDGEGQVVVLDCFELRGSPVAAVQVARKGMEVGAVIVAAVSTVAGQVGRQVATLERGVLPRFEREAWARRHLAGEVRVAKRVSLPAFGGGERAIHVQDPMAAILVGPRITLRIVVEEMGDRRVVERGGKRKTVLEGRRVAYAVGTKVVRTRVGLRRALRAWAGDNPGGRVRIQPLLECCAGDLVDVLREIRRVGGIQAELWEEKARKKGVEVGEVVELAAKVWFDDQKRRETVIEIAGEVVHCESDGRDAGRLDRAIEAGSRKDRVVRLVVECNPMAQFFEIGVLLNRCHVRGVNVPEVEFRLRR